MLQTVIRCDHYCYNLHYLYVTDTHCFTIWPCFQDREVMTQIRIRQDCTDILSQLERSGILMAVSL